MRELLAMRDGGLAMMPEPKAFAAEWIAAWNARDLDRILSHYADEVVFLSPVAARLLGNGRVEGIAALRDYWRKGLAGAPELRFELIDILVGYQCLTILYRNHRGQQVAETCEFGAAGRIVRSSGCYAEAAN